MPFRSLDPLSQEEQAALLDLLAPRLRAVQASARYVRSHHSLIGEVLDGLRRAARQMDKNPWRQRRSGVADDIYLTADILSDDLSMLTIEPLTGEEISRHLRLLAAVNRLAGERLTSSISRLRTRVNWFALACPEDAERFEGYQRDLLHLLPEDLNEAGVEGGPVPLG